MSINLLKQSPMCRCSVTLYTFAIFLARAHLENNSILFELANFIMMEFSWKLKLLNSRDQLNN